MWTKTAIYQQSSARPRWTASLSGTTRGCSTWMPESCEQNAYSRGRGCARRQMCWGRKTETFSCAVNRICISDRWCKLPLPAATKNQRRTVLPRLEGKFGASPRWTVDHSKRSCHSWHSTCRKRSWIWFLNKASNHWRLLWFSHTRY